MKAISSGWIVLGVLLLVLFMVYGFVKGTYNSLAVGEVQVEETWSNVESQYQRRFDLIPGLVESTRGIFEQEQEVFGAIADARRNYANAKQSGDQGEQVQATQQYESALARLLMVVENYPVLKSSETVRALMDELAGTENRINIARDRYNAQVSMFNKQISVFPQNLLAGMFGFEKKPFFESEEDADQAVKFDLSVDEDKQ